MHYQIIPISIQKSQDYDVERVSSQDLVQFEKCSQDIELDIQFLRDTIPIHPSHNLHDITTSLTNFKL